jgi:hypothetical protein
MKTYDDKWSYNRAYWFARGYHDARAIGIKDWEDSNPNETHYFYDKGFSVGVEDEYEDEKFNTP